MKPRTFNSVMPIVNGTLVSEILNILLNIHDGPDLMDNNKFVEVKFKLFPNEKNYIKWTVLGHQVDYNNQYPQTGYWGLGTYDLKIPVQQIKTKDKSELEGLVKNRKLYIIKWNWINQFEAYHNKGQTEIFQWDHYLHHAKFNKLPEIISEHKVKKRKIFLTKGIDKTYFPLLSPA